MSAHKAGIAEQVSCARGGAALGTAPTPSEPVSERARGGAALGTAPTPSEPVSERARGDCVVILYI